jgi:hypothetical protein
MALEEDLVHLVDGFGIAALLALHLKRGGDRNLQLSGWHLACLVGLELLKELVEIEGVILILLLLALLQSRHLQLRWWCTASSMP